MYVVETISDNFKVAPSKLSHIMRTLIESIESKYQNKMIEGKGIGITLYSLVKIDQGEIMVGTGDVYYNVVFNFIVYQPFVGEVIEGKVLRSLSTGIQVTLGFTDEIYIDQCYFPANCDLFVILND